MHLLLVFSLVVFLPLAVHSQQDEPCPVPHGKGSCVCQTRDGVIDLTSLSCSNGSAFFSEYDKYNYDYFYNPCHNFTHGLTKCSQGDVAVCQKEHRGSMREYNCGTSRSESIVKRSNGYYYVLYSGGTAGRSSEVRLICDQTTDKPTFSSFGDGGTPLLYKFNLQTKCACPGICQ